MILESTLKILSSQLCAHLIPKDTSILVRFILNPMVAISLKSTVLIVHIVLKKKAKNPRFMKLFYLYERKQ